MAAAPSPLPGLARALPRGRRAAGGAAGGGRAAGAAANGRPPARRRGRARGARCDGGGGGGSGPADGRGLGQRRRGRPAGLDRDHRDGGGSARLPGQRLRAPRRGLVPVLQPRRSAGRRGPGGHGRAGAERAEPAAPRLQPRPGVPGVPRAGVPAEAAPGAPGGGGGRGRARAPPQPPGRPRPRRARQDRGNGRILALVQEGPRAGRGCPGAAQRRPGTALAAAAQAPPASVRAPGNLRPLSHGWNSLRPPPQIRARAQLSHFGGADGEIPGGHRAGVQLRIPGGEDGGGAAPPGPGMNSQGIPAPIGNPGLNPGFLGCRSPSPTPPNPGCFSSLLPFFPPAKNSKPKREKKNPKTPNPGLDRDFLYVTKFPKRSREIPGEFRAVPTSKGAGASSGTLGIRAPPSRGFGIRAGIP